MLMLCEVLGSILRRKVKSMEENIKWLYTNVKYLLFCKMVIYLYILVIGMIGQVLLKAAWLGVHLKHLYTNVCSTENKQEELDILTQL